MGKIKLENSSIVVRNQEMLASNMDGETVMMSIENGEYYGLDTIGSRIWQLVAEPVEVSKIVKALLDEYDVEEPQCILDTMEFLNSLLEKDLLVVQPKNK